MTKTARASTSHSNLYPNLLTPIPIPAFCSSRTRPSSARRRTTSRSNANSSRWELPLLLCVWEGGGRGGLRARAGSGGVKSPITLRAGKGDWGLCVGGEGFERNHLEVRFSSRWSRAVTGPGAHCLPLFFCFLAGSAQPGCSGVKAEVQQRAAFMTGRAKHLPVPVKAGTTKH